MTTSKARRKAKGRYVVGWEFDNVRCWDFPASLKDAIARAYSVKQHGHKPTIFRLVRVRRGGK